MKLKRLINQIGTPYLSQEIGKNFPAPSFRIYLMNCETQNVALPTDANLGPLCLANAAEKALLSSM